MDLLAVDDDRTWALLAELRAVGRTPTVEARLAMFEGWRRALPPAAGPEARALLAELRDAGDGEALARGILAIAPRWTGIEAAERAALFHEALQAVSRPRVADRLRLQLADLANLSGDRSEAARLLEAISFDDLPNEAAHMYALQLRRLDRYDEAEAAWLGLIERPGVAERVQCLVWISIAHLRMTVGRLDEVDPALAAAEAVRGVGTELGLYLATTRFDHAIKVRDLVAARAALDDAPAARDPEHVALMAANRTCLEAIEGRWDAEAFRLLLSDVRADLRALGATGLMGASAREGDHAAALQALLAAERAHAASPVVGPELAWMAERAAAEWRRMPRRDRARAHRWAAQAALPVDGERAAQQLEVLRTLGVPLAGPFQLQAPLGRGGGGTVFSALHVSGLSAAVKVLHDASDTTRDLLDNELRAVAALDHPCIASLFDTGLVDEAEAATHPDLTAGTRWVASELIGGGELSSLCGGVGWDRALALALGILDALAHAHARDLLHLDIKPANVLLHPSGAPVLVDFGLARGIGSGRPELLSGTPEFMAPELFERGWTSVGPPTDLFSAACTLFQLVTGESPFSGTLQQVRRQHARGEPPRLQARVPVPDGLEGWLRTALAPNPADRFPTAASAAQALADLGPAGASAVPVPAPLPVSQQPTVVLDVSAGEGVAPRRSHGPTAAPEPRLPATWARTERRLRPEIATASLGLFEHRRPPLVGRRTERSVLWSSLVQAERGQRVLVGITGPEGSGRRALVRWLVERMREVGVGQLGPGPGRVPLVHLHEPDLDTIRAAGGPLVLVTAAEWPESWPDAVELALRPLDDATLRQILDRSLRLADDLAAILVARARGLPGPLVGALAELVALDRLVDGPDGYHLRRGATLPVQA